MTNLLLMLYLAFTIYLSINLLGVILLYTHKDRTGIVVKKYENDIFYKNIAIGILGQYGLFI